MEDAEFGMRRVALFLLVALAVPLAWAVPAHAHTELRSMDPASGATLQSPPSRVLLGFSEPVEVSFGSIRLVDASGRAVETGPARHPAEGSRFVAVEVPEIGAGTYVVAWRVLSADSHPIQGAFTFTVAAAPVAGEPPAPTPAPDTRAVVRSVLSSSEGSSAVGVVYGVFRFITFAGLLALVGAGAFVLLLWRAGLRERRVRRTLAAAWAAAVVGTAGSIALQGAYAAGRPLGDALDPSVMDAVLDTRFGSASLARLGLLALVSVMLWVAFRRGGVRRRGPFAVAGAVLATGLLVTPGIAGHAAASENAALMILIDTIHLGAASFWLGGLAVLLAAVLPRGNTDEMGGVVPRFSRLAFGAVLVILATGSVQGLEQVGSLDALTETTYGRLLIIKVGIFAAMVGVAALSRGWVRRRYYGAQPATSPAVGAAPFAAADVGRLRRSVAAEAAAAAAVIAVTALLVNAVPARSALAQPVSRSLETGTVVIDVTVDPAKAGPTDVHLYTLEPTGSVKDVAEVNVTLSLPGSRIGRLDVPLQRAGPGHFSAYGFEIPVPGRWQLDVDVRTSDGKSAQDRATIPVR